MTKEETEASLLNLAEIQLISSSVDDYNLGMYNGVPCALALVMGPQYNPRFLKLEEFKDLQKQMQKIKSIS